MKRISFLPPHSALNSEKDRKLVQSQIRVHTAQHRLQQAAERKQQAAADYWRSFENNDIDHGVLPSHPSPETPASPQSILRKGNSDPFSAYAIAITPRLNQILSFYTTNFLPTYWNIATVSSPSSQAILNYRHVEAQNDYKGAVGALQHRSAAHGFFLAYGEIMACLSGDPDHRLEIMKLKSLAVSALQHQIKEYGEDDPRTLDAILMLFQAAVFTGTHAEADIHGRSLRRLLYQKALREGPQSVDVGHLFQALWLNLSLSATFMTPTLLDVDTWAPSIFNAVLDESHVKSLPPVSASTHLPWLDHAICGPLRTIFGDCRQFLWYYWTCPSLTTSEEDTANLFTYLYSDFFIHSSRIVNHLVRIKSGRLAGDCDALPLRSHEEIFRWHTQHVLTIGLLVLMSASTATVLHAGHALVMATSLLLARLKDALEPVLRTCLSPSMSTRCIDLDSADPRDSLCRAALWALFIGTTIDHIPEAKQVHGTQASTWFTDKFLDLIRRKRLQTADGVKVILRRFVYTDDMLSDEAFWNKAFKDRPSG